MTVIKRKQQRYTHTENTTDAEILRLEVTSASSDGDSVHNEPIIIRQPTRILCNLSEEFVSLRKCSGKRRVRRHENKTFLQTLVEQDETNDENFVCLMDYNESPFSKLLNNQEAFEFWNCFINKSDDEQLEIINSIRDNNKQNNQNCKLDKPIKRLSPKLRRIIKTISIDKLKQFENELIEFFNKTPKDIYIKYLSTYFDRLLVHAIAQYHKLFSLGINENGLKKVEVFNNIPNWLPVDFLLADFMIQIKN